MHLNVYLLNIFMHVHRLQVSFINIQTKPNTIRLNIFGFLLGGA